MRFGLALVMGGGWKVVVHNRRASFQVGLTDDDAF